MNDETILRRVARNRFELFDRGDLLLPALLRPCRLKILVVVDGYPGDFLNVSFSNSYFGLSVVMDTLRENPEWWAKFDITRAHRQTDSFKPDPVAEPVLNARYGPHYEGFRFAGPGKPGDFDIDDYDQVWLFGARANESDSERLTDDELEVLARWMDERQGGLFATGDHADLGASLCARVPRAGTMRRWTSTDGVPSATGVNRHDTLLKGHDAFYTFNDESDDLPMTTTVRRYPVSGWSRFLRSSMPHPVLCGTDGVIDILPDHPHEGWVNEDADVTLTNTVIFGGYSAPEYPVSGGAQPTPEVIAWAHVQGDHTEGRSGSPGTDRNKGPANGTMFGAIGAYNGHQADIGRVVVDSTWHHWFDVNLSGRPTDGGDLVDPVSAGDPKAAGFEYSTAGLVALGRIKNYFRNVALWLASPAQQRCMFLRATWGAVHRYHLVENLDLRIPLWELGGFARDVIGRRAGQCTIREWLFPLFPPEILELVEPRRDPKLPVPDPCLSCPPFEAFELMALGGIAREMMALSQNARIEKAKITEKAVAKCLAKGLNTGISELTKRFEQSQVDARRLSKELARIASLDVDPQAFVAPEQKNLKPRGGKGRKRKTKK